MHLVGTVVGKFNGGLEDHELLTSPLSRKRNWTYVLVHLVSIVVFIINDISTKAMV